MKNQLVRAARNRCKIKMALQGPSGSGKTYSALLAAYGITGDWSKIAVLDTENGSAHLYCDLGPYWVINMNPPFTPEDYIEAIDKAEVFGIECLIIDSISAEWSGQGGVLDIHSNIPGNSFTAWAKVTPRHNAFMQAILQSNMHVIATMRSKTDYVITEKNGKQVPEKVGLKAVQRDDSEYEFTIVMELTQRHIAMVTKDRTGLFRNRPEMTITAEVGKAIAEWCNGTEPQQENNNPRVVETVVETITDISFETEEKQDDFEVKINSCQTVDALKELYNNHPSMQNRYRENFIARRNQITAEPKTFSSNGVHH
jgi:hypothetical protein